jgi:hypothetical protein
MYSEEGNRCYISIKSLLWAGRCTYQSQNRRYGTPSSEENDCTKGKPLRRWDNIYLVRSALANWGDWSTRVTRAMEVTIHIVIRERVSIEWVNRISTCIKWAAFGFDTEKLDRQAQHSCTSLRLRPVKSQDRCCSPVKRRPVQMNMMFRPGSLK